MTPVNVGQSVRNAFVHALAWWQQVAEESPTDINIARCLRSSQLLRNVVTWFCANDVARQTALAFYGSDGRVDLARLPSMMALVCVACQVTGMPHWTHAALEANDIDNNVSIIASQAREDESAKNRATSYMSGRLTELATEVLAAMRDLQDRPDFEASSHFGTVTLREMELLRGMRHLTAVATRLLVIQRIETEACVRATLRSFVESCGSEPEAAMSNPAAAEPLAAKLAEQVADKMTSVEQRLRAVEERACAAQAAANGAEQIAEAAERAAVKAAGAHKPPRAPSTKLVARVDALAARLGQLETGVSVDVGDLMKGMVKLDHKVACMHDDDGLTVAALEALTARVAVLETALTARVAAVERAAATRVTVAEEAAAARVAVLEAALTARIGDMVESACKARTADMASKLDHLAAQAQTQFWSQWHALQMQWAVVCRPREDAALAAAEPAPRTPCLSV